MRDWQSALKALRTYGQRQNRLSKNMLQRSSSDGAREATCKVCELSQLWKTAELQCGFRLTPRRGTPTKIIGNILRHLMHER